jgi:hypothetical protein
MASTTKFGVTRVEEEMSVSDDVPEPPGEDTWGALLIISAGAQPGQSQIARAAP